MQLHVEVNDGVITATLDGVDLFGRVNDSDLPSGSIALYCWGNQNCYFDNVDV